MDNEWLAWQGSLMVTFATAKTAQELRDASALTLCYDDEGIEAFIARRDRDGLLAALLAIPGADACWALAAWLPVKKRIEWARGSARRAKEYGVAYAAYASHAAADGAAVAAVAERRHVERIRPAGPPRARKVTPALGENACGHRRQVDLRV